MDGDSPQNLFNRLQKLTLAFSILILNGMAQSTETLSSLPKDSLIALAVQKISEPSFHLDDFSRIEIWLDDKDLIVEFGHAIKFIPKKGQAYYSVIVNLVDGSSTLYIEGDGPFNATVKFYRPSQYKNRIKFVIDAINNSSGVVGKIPDGKFPDGIMTIQERALYYDVTVDSESTHSYYKIKKGSGKIYDAGHKHYAHSNDSSRKRIY